MKRIPFVADFPGTDIFGAPIMDPSTGSQVVVSQEQFILQRLTDPATTKGKNMIDAVEMILKTRDQIRAQKEEAPERGYYLLEDEPARAVANAALHPSESYPHATLHNLFPLLAAFRDMKDQGEEVEQKPKAPKLVDKVSFAASKS